MSKEDFGLGLFDSAPSSKRKNGAVAAPVPVHRIMDLGEAPTHTFTDQADQEDDFLFGGQPMTSPTAMSSKRNSRTQVEPDESDLDEILAPSRPVYSDDFDFEGGAAQAVAKSQKKSKNKRNIFVTLGLISAVIATVIATSVLGGGKPDTTPVAAKDSWFSKIDQTQESDNPLPLEDSFMQWKIKPADKSSYSVYGAGIVGVEDGSLIAYDLAGKRSTKLKLKDPISYTLETKDRSGNPAVAWKSADQLGIWSPASGVTTLKIQKDAEVSSNGTGLLVHQQDGKTFAALPGAKELKKLPAAPQGYSLVALDGDKLLNISTAKRSAKLTDISGNSPQDISLKAPVAGAALNKIVGAGHGVVAALWSAGPDDRLATLAVHRLDSEDTVYLPVSTTKAQDMKWTVGQGMKLATFGPYAIDLDSGAAVISVDAQNIVMAGALGALPYAEDESGSRRFILDGEIFGSSETQIIGVTSDGAVVIRLPDGTIESRTDGKV